MMTDDGDEIEERTLSGHCVAVFSRGGLFIAFTSTISKSSFFNITASNAGGLNTTGSVGGFCSYHPDGKLILYYLHYC